MSREVSSINLASSILRTPKLDLRRDRRVWFATIAVVLIVSVVLITSTVSETSANLGSSDEGVVLLKSGLSALSFLVGEWTATLQRFDTESGQLVATDSKLTMYVAPNAKDKSLSISLDGTFNGRAYKCSGRIYFDDELNLYKKTWADNIASSPVFLSGNFAAILKTEGEVSVPAPLLRLVMTTSNGQLEEWIESYGPGSASIRVIDRVSKQELTRFSLMRSLDKSMSLTDSVLLSQMESQPSN